MGDFDVPDTIDLTDPDRHLTRIETSDVIHRADYPRSAIVRKFGSGVVGMVTGWAADLADARCGVPVDFPPGPHPWRGTLRWYRHYIAHLDDCADILTPGWRDDTHEWGPYPWCEAAFGQVNFRGRSGPARGRGNTLGYDRDPDKPRVIGRWQFDLPPRQV